jgi:hypothetical protein
LVFTRARSSSTKERGASEAEIEAEIAEIEMTLSDVRASSRASAVLAPLQYWL